MSYATSTALGMLLGNVIGLALTLVVQYYMMKAACKNAMRESV